MSLREKLEQDIKSAMKSGDSLRVSALRMTQAAIHNKEIQLLKKEIGLSDQEVIEVLQSEVKKRKDAATEFEKAGRSELAQKEKAESEILSTYLPAQMSDEDLERILEEGIREAGASSQKDFGRVMKVAMPILKGKASGDRISAMLKKLLG